MSELPIDPSAGEFLADVEDQVANPTVAFPGALRAIKDDDGELLVNLPDLLALLHVEVHKPEHGDDAASALALVTETFAFVPVVIIEETLRAAYGQVVTAAGDDAAAGILNVLDIVHAMLHRLAGPNPEMN